jgi:hypothetical protein
MKNTIFRRHFAPLSLLAFAANSAALGQAPGTGAISGVVIDSSSRVIGNAEVEAVNEVTHASRSAFTSSEGVFRVPLLLPGTYTVTVRAAGFASRISAHVEVTVSETASLSFSLSVAGTGTTVDAGELGRGTQNSRTVSRYQAQNAFTITPEAPYGSSSGDTDLGNSGVGFVRGRGQPNVEMAVERTFPVTNSISFHFRTEFFNITNTPQFADPNKNVDFTPGPTGLVKLHPAFGQITSTIANPRIIQFAAKFQL